jgi:hypothetical protein
MTTPNTPAAQKSETTFRTAYSVRIGIDAAPDAVWARLTNAADFSRWNSTVTRMGGEIAPGKRLEIEVPLAPGRTFKPRVVSMEPAARMVWSDGAAPMFKGERVFALQAENDGTTTFEMTETFAGVLMPLIRRSLPDFRAAFEQYAHDLKNACEA